MMERPWIEVYALVAEHCGANDARRAAGLAALGALLPSGPWAAGAHMLTWHGADARGGQRLEIDVHYSAMSDFGIDRVYEYRITVRPTFGGRIDVSVRGPEATGTRGFMADVFRRALASPVRALFSGGYLTHAEWAL